HLNDRTIEGGAMTKTPAILSLLHQDQIPASTTRIFRNQSVLRCTLERLSACRALSQATILCWANQFSALRGFENVIALPRVDLPSMQAITAARRWADGWR